MAGPREGNPMTTATAKSSQVSMTARPALATTPTQMQFGDLILAFTTRYEWRWDDKGSGADDDASFHHPVPPEGFYALGSVGLNNHDSPDGRFASLCVKASPSASGKPPLAFPVRWEYVWDDSGSGADQDGSCWRPVPPEGYVALGEVFVNGHSPPTGVQVACVARELVIEGSLGGCIWRDNGSGANRDFGAWQVDASTAYLDTPDGVFAVNSFAGRESHDKPGSSPVAWNLRLPLPTYEAGGPPKPVLASRASPPPCEPAVDRIVTLPFTALADADKDLAWQVANSPFYTVERSVGYDLVKFIDNTTGTPQSASKEVTTGVSTEKSETFSRTTGITVGYEVGVKAGAFSTKASMSLTVELGYASSTSVEQIRSTTDEATLIAASQHAAALWVQSNSLRAFRADGSPVGPSMAFATTGTSYVVSEFPDDGPTGGRKPSMVARGRRRLLDGKAGPVSLDQVP